MRQPISLVRRTVIAVAVLVMAGSPVGAQANTNTTSTSALVTPDSARRAPADNDRGFPWGLLGLLGLAGLLGRRRTETVRTVPPATVRPGEPAARM